MVADTTSLFVNLKFVSIFRLLNSICHPILVYFPIYYSWNNYSWIILEISIMFLSDGGAQLTVYIIIFNYSGRYFHSEQWKYLYLTNSIRPNKKKENNNMSFQSFIFLFGFSRLFFIMNTLRYFFSYLFWHQHIKIK